MTPHYVAVANPAGKRWQTYQADLLAFWAERGVCPTVEVVPWPEVVARDGDLDGLAAFDAPAVVRLESPGRDFETTRRLLAAGSREVPDAPRLDWLSLPYRKGLLLHPRLL